MISFIFTTGATSGALGLESKLEVEHKISEQDCPSNTAMRARIYPEVGHTMCTMCEKTSKFCKYCSTHSKNVAPNSTEVKIKNRNKNLVKAREVPSTKKFNIENVKKSEVNMPETSSDKNFKVEDLKASPVNKYMKYDKKRNRENNETVEVAPIYNVANITVSNTGLGPRSKHYLKCLSMSNSYHRNHYKVLDKPPGSKMVRIGIPDS